MLKTICSKPSRLISPPSKPEIILYSRCQDKAGKIYPISDLLQKSNRFPNLYSIYACTIRAYPAGPAFP